MKKWYRSAVVKGALVLLAVLMAAGFVASAYDMVAFLPIRNVEELFGQYEEDYLETPDFENNFHIASMTILSSLRNRENFETEGVYDDQKIVDIEEYDNYGRISGENVSGFAYRLSDLEKWSQEYEEDT